MINKLAKLEHLAWTIQMKTEIALEEAKKKEEAELLRGYRAAQKHTAENLIEHTTELQKLIREIKQDLHKSYLEEDIDFGNLGQEVDEYA